MASSVRRIFAGKMELILIKSNFRATGPTKTDPWADPELKMIMK